MRTRFIEKFDRSHGGWQCVAKIDLIFILCVVSSSNNWRHHKTSWRLDNTADKRSGWVVYLLLFLSKHFSMNAWSVYLEFCTGLDWTCVSYIVGCMVAQAWDDVERRARPADKMVEYSKRAVVDQEKSKLSLGEVYEQQYLKQSEVGNSWYNFFYKNASLIKSTLESLCKAFLKFRVSCYLHFWSFLLWRCSLVMGKNLALHN